MTYAMKLALWCAALFLFTIAVGKVIHGNSTVPPAPSHSCPAGQHLAAVKAGCAP